MSARLGVWRYPVALAVGIVISLVSGAVARAFDSDDVAFWIDAAIGVIGVAFAISLLTGFNLGRTELSRSVVGDAGSLITRRPAGAC